jgi:hypothetical protein
MARIVNPRKGHNFFLVLGGVDQFLIQEITFPDLSVDVVEHGDINYIVKTPGIMKIGPMELKKLSPTEATDNWALLWLFAAQTPGVGGLIPAALTQSVIIEERDASNMVTVSKILWEGAWVSQVQRAHSTRVASENRIESVTLQVERPIILK